MTTAEVLVKCLENEGVQYIYGIPGEENLEVIEALKGSSIKFITVRHEQGAAFMADMQGRLTGKAGVCLATLGPGATNLVTGVADANMDGAPLVAITGQVGTDRMHHMTSHQNLDLETLFAPITHKTKQVVRPDTVNEIVRIAFKYAEGAPGASHIDLPCNIAAMEVPEGPGQKPLRRQVPVSSRAGDAMIRQAAEMIARADRPVVLAGADAVRSGAAEALTNFMHSLGIAVVNTMMAKGAVPCDDPLSMWTVGIPHMDYQNVLLRKADLIIGVGYDIVEYSPEKWNHGGHANILSIGRRPIQVNRMYQPNLEVIGDIAYTLGEISKVLHGRKKADAGWALEIGREMRAEHESYSSDTSFPMKPQRVLCDVRRSLGAADILVSDVGAHKMWIARHYNCFEPNTCIISNGFATMGIGVPGAFAAKLLFPEKRVLTITGDGGFMMNCQEIETAVRMHVSFVTLIFRDSHYGLIKWKQEDRFGSSSCVGFGNPDFVKFAESMGAIGYRVTKAEELPDILENAFRQEVPVIIDCPIDYSENTKLTAHEAEIWKRYMGE